MNRLEILENDHNVFLCIDHEARMNPYSVWVENNRIATHNDFVNAFIDFDHVSNSLTDES